MDIFGYNSGACEKKENKLEGWIEQNEIHISI